MDDLINNWIEFKNLNTINKHLNSASYVAKYDFKKMPLINSFKDCGIYYSTLFHELIHWSGDKSRLNRFDVNKMNYQQYESEELVAEIGSM